MILSPLNSHRGGDRLEKPNVFCFHEYFQRHECPRLWLLVPGKDTYIASCLWLQGWVPSCMKLCEYLPPHPPSRCLEGWSVKWLATRHGDPSPGADSGKGDRGRTYFLPGPAISVRCPSRLSWSWPLELVPRDFAARPLDTKSVFMRGMEECSIRKIWMHTEKCPCFVAGKDEKMLKIGVKLTQKWLKSCTWQLDWF